MELSTQSSICIGTVRGRLTDSYPISQEVKDAFRRVFRWFITAVDVKHRRAVGESRLTPYLLVPNSKLFVRAQGSVSTWHPESICPPIPVCLFGCQTLGLVA